MAEHRSFTFEAIGTTWQIDIFDALAQDRAEGLVRRIQARIEEFDRAYSRFREDSLVTAMSKQEGEYEMPQDVVPMLRLYEQMYKITQGLVTPFIGNVLVEAGYDAQYSLRPKTLHVPPPWEEVMAFSSPTVIQIKQPAVLDFGAMGKGYLIDIVAELLWEEGLRSFCVDAGGDILLRKSDKVHMKIGLEHPQDVTQVIGVAEIMNGSLCGSAGNRRAWANFHHIINPKTLTSPRDILAAWAVASTTMLADATTTGLFFCVTGNVA
jgi:thiamine biosynthesis lipoprotein